MFFLYYLIILFFLIYLNNLIYNIQIQKVEGVYLKCIWDSPIEWVFSNTYGIIS